MIYYYYYLKTNYTVGVILYLDFLMVAISPSLNNFFLAEVVGVFDEQTWKYVTGMRLIFSCHLLAFAASQ